MLAPRGPEDRRERGSDAGVRPEIHRSNRLDFLALQGVTIVETRSDDCLLKPEPAPGSSTVVA